METKCRFMVAGKVAEIGEVETFASGFTKRRVVVETSPDAEKYTNPVELTLKKEECDKADSLHVGDSIEAEGFVEGRKWEGPKGVRFFIDLHAKSIIVTGKAELPTTAKSWKELVALGAAYGEGEDAVKERAKKLGKGFKEMTEADWQKLAADIVAAHAQKADGDIPPEGGDDDSDDDMPF